MVLFMIYIYIYAFSKKPTSTYSFNTKIWEENNKGITWNGGLFEHKDNILTGRYFNRCCIRWIDIDKGYTPRPKQIIGLCLLMLIILI